MTGRELRVIDLKREVNELAERLGEPPHYDLDFEENNRMIAPEEPV
jgi:hypothetical protein